jgi:hypothetical protein
MFFDTYRGMAKKGGNLIVQERGQLTVVGPRAGPGSSSSSSKTDTLR